MLAVAIAVAALVVVSWLRSGPSKDPARLFSAEQKRAGHARAGHRCEMELLPFIRCRRPSEHGDHWYPHSRGGATTMGNFVAACSPCNLRKSATMPSRFATARLSARRRRYFPSGVPVRSGERYRP